MHVCIYNADFQKVFENITKKSSFSLRRLPVPISGYDILLMGIGFY
jgi:hypothetical protein